MKNGDAYNCIEFKGLLLNPSFSIYLYEIINDEKDVFFYVGMTVDNHYPSARSILHRFAGHISMAKTSTQSQLINGIRAKIFKKKTNEHLSEEELAVLNIKLHYWPIEGFQKWNNSLKKFKKEDLNDEESKMYDDYKKKQRPILQLEKYLINYLQKTVPEYCLNEPENGMVELKTGHNHIFDAIKTIIEKRTIENE